MSGTWVSCIKCGHRYGAWIANCPKCGFSNSAYKTPSGKRLSTKIVIIVVIVVGVFGGLAAFGYHFGSSSPVMITAAPPLQTVSLGPNGNYSIVKANLNGYQVDAYLALTNKQKEKGMSIFDRLNENQGMLFVLEKEQTYLPMWAKDMKFPVDLIWLDNAGNVQYIEKSISPCHSYNDCIRYQPDVNSRYVLGTVGGFSVRHFISLGMKATFDVPPNVSPEALPYPAVSISQNIDELRQYALKKINEDRANHNLPPVALDPNSAAQAHSEEIVMTNQLSHWTLDGMKPYMRYSVYGGNYYVAQNADITFIQGGDQVSQINLKLCQQGLAICGSSIDPHNAIDDAENAMMNNDYECCHNGHRDNILDRYHTHVSIGVAYNVQTFALIQNFENEYINWTKPIAYDSSSEYVHMAGNLEQGMKFDGISIYYDPLPTPQTYLDHRNDTSYSAGTFVADVEPPAPSGSYYDQSSNYTLIIASNWNVADPSFDMGFSLSSLTQKYGNGVYTLTLFSKDQTGASVPLTTKSLFIPG